MSPEPPTTPAAAPATALAALQRASDHLASELDADLGQAHGLSLRAFELLRALDRPDPDRWVRMRELTAQVHLSQSRTSRLVAQLERERLVSRRADGVDGRGIEVALTSVGLRTVRAADATHRQGLHRLVVSRLAPDEVQMLTALTARLLPPDAAGPPLVDDPPVPHVVADAAHGGPPDQRRHAS